MPSIFAAVGGRIGVVLDSGIRRGADLLKATALGADFALTGRALAYGVGAGGACGAERAVDILKLELVRALGQFGATFIVAVGALGPAEIQSR